MEDNDMLTNQLIALGTMVVLLVFLVSGNPLKTAEVRSKVRK